MSTSRTRGHPDAAGLAATGIPRPVAECGGPSPVSRGTMRPDRPSAAEVPTTCLRGGNCGVRVRHLCSVAEDLVSGKEKGATPVALKYSVSRDLTP